MIVLAVNAAIAAYYYLGLVKAPLLTDPDPDAAPMTETPVVWRRLATVLSASGVIALAIAADPFMRASETAGRTRDLMKPDHGAGEHAEAVPVAPDDR